MSFSVCDTIVSEISNFVVNRGITWDSGGKMNFESEFAFSSRLLHLTSYIIFLRSVNCFGFPDSLSRKEAMYSREYILFHKI